MSSVNPKNTYPIKGVKRVKFLSNCINHPNIIVGDYTYYDDPLKPFSIDRNVLYLFPTCKNILKIGKFCQIASGVRFIMNGANHNMTGYSTYPFNSIMPNWNTEKMKIHSKGDTVIGNDVWLGNSVTIMPGIRIGDGAIVGTNALVTKDVAPYSIVGGNPARLIRMRFSPEEIEYLLNLKWWDWPIEKIEKNLNSLL